MKKMMFLPILLGMALACGAQELTTFGGYHTQLYGYTDKRYIDRDKGDYLKTLAWYSGSEFVQRGFQTDDPITKNIVLGGGAILYVQNPFDSRKLYAVNGNGVSLAEETVPSDSNAATARFQAVLSAFGGYQAEWWGAEGGLSVFMKGVEEKVRKRRAADGTEIDGSGRGWVFGDGSLVLPNVLLRVGLTSLPHFVMSLYRGHYDPGLGALQALVVLPVSTAFTLQVGGSTFQTSSVFLEPKLVVGDFTASVRAGTVLNYNDSSFTKVGIFEGAFASAALAVRW